MRNKVGLESLRPSKVLYEGDVYGLACLFLKLADAKTQGTNARSRPTVHGLATAYARLVINNSSERVEAVHRRHGLPPGAIIERDDRGLAPTD